MGTLDDDKPGTTPSTGDPGGGHPNPSTLQGTAETPVEIDQPFTYMVRISFKERKGEEIKYVELMRQLLREVTRHDPNAKMSDHGGRKFSLADFPLQETDFKKAFDGGADEDNGYKTPPTIMKALAEPAPSLLGAVSIQRKPFDP